MGTASENKVKAEFIKAYGSACTCCGEINPHFLSLEHLRGDGKEHRIRCGNHGGNALYRDLRRRNWPQEDYTTLCYNCNFTKGARRKCDHTHDWMVKMVQKANIMVRYIRNMA